jgi:putative hydrolase of HD superfamily
MDPPLRVFRHVARLKQVSRAGWSRCGVEPCESVAEHTFGVAVLALLLPKAAGLKLDRERCVAMALVHDLAEAVVGDITPHDGVAPEEKHRREREAIERMAKELGDVELIGLWNEFEIRETDEAKLVRELDVIEMAFQAREYERAGRLSPEQAMQFVRSAQERVSSQAGKELLTTLIAPSPA